MRFGTPARIVTAAGLLALALIGLVVREGVARAQGREVRLAIEAYDPRSLLSGHYLQFQIQDRPAGDSACPPGAEGDPRSRIRGWIALVPAGGRHRAAGFADSRAGAERLGPVAVRGRLTCLPRGRPGPEGAQMEPEMTAVLDLGVDRFHAEQDQAERMEAALVRGAEGMPDGETPLAVVSVGRDGKARLKAVVIGGRRTDLDWF